MNLKMVLLEQLSSIAKLPHIDKAVYDLFLKRINANQPLLREQNEKDHVCCFFLPVHFPTKSLYLVHHIKAGSWIPPGGHIDPGETPLQTIKREFKEELDFSLTDEAITLFDISIKHIDAKTHPCKIHYDLWYTVSCRETAPFRFLHKEFYDAGWFEFKHALSKIEHQDYQSIVRKLKMRV